MTLINSEKAVQVMKLSMNQRVRQLTLMIE